MSRKLRKASPPGAPAQEHVHPPAPAAEPCPTHKCPTCNWLSFETVAVDPNARLPVKQLDCITKEWVDRGIIH